MAVLRINKCIKRKIIACTCVCWKEQNERMGRSWVLTDIAIYLLFYWLSSCYCFLSSCPLIYSPLHHSLPLPTGLIFPLCIYCNITSATPSCLGHSLNLFLTLSRFSHFDPTKWFTGSVLHCIQPWNLYLILKDKPEWISTASASRCGAAPPFEFCPISRVTVIP